jgi:predicted RNase H-like HicB family nuclease
MRNYLIVLEKAERNFSAYAPDLPGCVATGKTRHRAEQEMATAIRMHIDGLIEDGLPVPEPSAQAEVVSVP